jgi:hypothetical protein
MLIGLLGLLGVGGVAGIALRLFGLSGTIAKVTSFGSGAKAAAMKVPRWVWIALAVTVVLVGGYLWVNHKIHQAYTQGHTLGRKEGHAAQFAYDQAIMAKARAQARAFKKQLDTANTTIHNQEQTRHDQTVAANHALADALRMRFDRQSNRPQARGGGGGHLPGATVAGLSTGGSQPGADAQLGQAADRPIVCVDAQQLIDYAEQADNDHDALVKTEDAHKRYLEHWPSGATAPPQ